MIRVGDIYEDLTKETVTCTITFVSPHTVNVLGNTGGMFTFNHNPKEEADFLRNRKLVGAYNTWVEAVNSEEFNNVERN